MDKVVNKWAIAKGIVRITLFRILPGHELEVGRIIEKQCKKINLTKSHYRLFRLFGNYDLVFIQDYADLSSNDLIKLGTIPYVTGISECVCYKWKHFDKSLPTFRINQLSKPASALCFLKINPIIVQRSGIQPEVLFADFLQSKLKKIQMVGNLGWFEIILLLSDNSLSQILDTIGKKLPSLIYEYRPDTNEPVFFVEKTLSMLGHELDVSDPKVNTTRSKVKLFDDNLTQKDLSVHFALSCKPRAMYILKEEAENHFKLEKGALSKGVNLRFGPRDLDFSIPLQNIKTLNELLKNLDGFRKKNRKNLIKTYTDIQSKKHQPEGPTTDTIEVMGYLMVKITPKQTEKLLALGREGESVISAVNRYNNLIVNNLVADAYTDLLEFVKAIRDIALHFSDNLSTRQRYHIIDRIKIIGDAVEQRSQGVYTGLEETPFSIGLFESGHLRVSKAIESIIIKLLHRFSVKWNGFVLCGNSPRFEHQNEAIIIPSEYSVSAKTHWALTHETMHILQHIWPEYLSANNLFPETNCPSLCEYRRGGRWWHLIHEVTADVLDYAVCCPCKIEQYLETIWGYLTNELFDHHIEEQTKTYLLRSFSVICYDFVQKSKNPLSELLSPKGIKRILNRKNSFFYNYDKLQYLFKQNKAGETSFELIIQDFVNEVGPALPFIIKRTQEISKKIEKCKIKNNKIKNCINVLKKGRILNSKDLENPESIAWHLSLEKDKPFSDESQIAWILSLWHQYNIERLGFDMEKLIT